MMMKLSYYVAFLERNADLSPCLYQGRQFITGLGISVNIPSLDGLYMRASVPEAGI